MNFNRHSNLEGQHAFLGASKYHWINYSEDKVAEAYSKFLATQPGTWQFPGQLKDAWSSALIPCMEQLQYQHQPLRSRSHGSDYERLLR